MAPRNLELARENALRQVEEYLQKAVESAKLGGVTAAEVKETLDILYGEE